MRKVADPAPVRRKLIAFDEPTWQTLNVLARDSLKSWQELADEAFRDLLRKHGRPTDLRAALKQSMTRESSGQAKSGAARKKAKKKPAKGQA
jgi:hypothetical protein